jgi:ligand-binding sensor domain-containing protein
MQKSYNSCLICLLIFVITLVTSCKGQSNANTENNTSNHQSIQKEGSQIGEYLVNIFEDSKGNLWFGTLEKGVAKYDGKTLTYFTTTDGLPSNRVVSMVEDLQGNLWFGTGTGLSKYDGKTFTNFTTKDGLCNDGISNLLIDRKGDFWIGTWGGVCKFNGSSFTNFTLPIPTIKTTLNEDTKNWITQIYEDVKGNIWISRDGYGVSKYDGINFTHFTKMDGLASNNVQDIQEDAQSAIWFSSRVAERDHPDPDKRQGAGGLIKYDGEDFISFPDIEGLSRNDVYQIYRDSKDNLWISTISNGMYAYNGDVFTNYPVVDPVTKKKKAVMSFLEDRNGTIWIGCAGGLFRLDAGVATNITTNGPWK